MTFALIVSPNLEKFFFEWLTRCSEQTWTAFWKIYIRLMSDSSRSGTLSVHTMVTLLQSLRLSFLCMSIKNYWKTTCWVQSQRPVILSDIHRIFYHQKLFSLLRLNNYWCWHHPTPNPLSPTLISFSFIFCRVLFCDIQHCKHINTILGVICFVSQQFSSVSHWD